MRKTDVNGGSRGDETFPADFDATTSQPVCDPKPNFTTYANTGQFVNKAIDPDRVKGGFDVQVDKIDELIICSGSVDIVVKRSDG